MPTSVRPRRFWRFYREYTESAVHTASLVALTALGLLSTVDRWFIALAVAAYVVPALSLYLRNRVSADDDVVPEDPVERESPGSIEERDEGAEPEVRAGGEDRTSTGGGSAPSDREPTGASDGDRGRVESTVGRGGESEDETRRTGAAIEKGGNRRERTAEPTGESESDSGAETGDDQERVTTTEGDEKGRTETAATGQEAPEEDAPEPGWHEVETPTEEPLTDATAAGERAFAVGGGGTMLARAGEGWETVLEEGPTGRSTNLTSTSATEDGERVWVAGDGGVLASYDPESGRVTDRSAPLGITSSWTDCAAIGPAGEESLTLLTGSGEVVRGTVSGAEIEWNEPVKPGSGSSATGVAYADGTGYVCDSNASVFETVDGGEFERIGVEGGGSFTDVAAVAPGEVSAVASDGSVHRYDGTTWTRSQASEGALMGIDLEGDRGLACSDTGEILDREPPGWEVAPVPTEVALNAVSIDPTGADLAVGDDGTVLERGINSA
jgi:hypothetical protein